MKRTKGTSAVCCGLLAFGFYLAHGSCAEAQTEPSFDRIESRYDLPLPLRPTTKIEFTESSGISNLEVELEIQAGKSKAKRKVREISASELLAIKEIRLMSKCREIWIGTEVNEAGEVHITALEISNDCRLVAVPQIQISGKLGCLEDQLNRLTKLKALYPTNLCLGGFSFRKLTNTNKFVVLQLPIDASDDDVRALVDFKNLKWLELVGCFNMTGSFIGESWKDSRIEVMNFELSGLTLENARKLGGLKGLRKIVVPNTIRSKYYKPLKKEDFVQILDLKSPSEIIVDKANLEKLRDGMSIMRRSDWLENPK